MTRLSKENQRTSEGEVGAPPTPPSAVEERLTKILRLVAVVLALSLLTLVLGGVVGSRESAPSADAVQKAVLAYVNGSLERE